MKTTRMMRVLQATAMTVLGLGLVSCASMPQSEVEAKRADVRAMASKTLSQLYEKHPEAVGAVANSAGYAVFSDFGFKVWTLGGAKGGGVAIDDGQETFMKMWEFQPGMGIGASKFRVVMLFKTQKEFDKFASGTFEFGLNFLATAKASSEGGSISGAVAAAEGVEIYQLDETGAIIGISITAVRFSQDSDLN
jgi:lipid-binding SYLF domain-containing protein